jgi:hypothetical protein
VEVAADVVVVAVMEAAAVVVATVAADMGVAEVATKSTSHKFLRPRQDSRPFSFLIIQSSDGASKRR